MHVISLGKHNPTLIALRKAIDHGTLTPDGLLPIEGPKLIEEAHRGGLTIESIFLRRGTAWNSTIARARIYEVEPALFKTIQGTETSQGVIALVRPRKFLFADLFRTPNPLLVVLARLQDPGNVGTILRVAESFHASGCVAFSGTAGVFNSKTVRASAGSIFRLPYVWNVEAARVFDESKAAGIQLIGTSPSATTTIDRVNWRNATAILIGNEGSGLSDEELRHCDEVARIPHNPEVESLNSAIAASILLYEAFKQRSV